MLWMEEGAIDDSAPWGSIFKIEFGKLLLREKDIRTMYEFMPIQLQALK